ncbi:MAG: NAD(+) synthase, partial [Planctomycetota bacterium]
DALAAIVEGAARAVEDEFVAQAKAFEEDLLVVDFAGSTKTTVQIGGESPRVETVPTGIESMHGALVLGTRDYLRKCGFKRAVIGLSGGIDSALTCAIACEALGPENVTGVAMPSKYSSDHSVTDAEQLAINCGMTEHGNYRVVPIKPMHDAYANALGGVVEMTGLTEENLQARIRGATLMSFSNKTGALLLTTGNKSELAVGYCTLYGDMCGGLAVISDVPKTQVTAMCRWINETAGREVIPENTITKPPSAELAPDQKDSDSLPPYDELDRILELYIEDDASAATIVEAGHDEDIVAKVLKLVDRSEFKRRQAAPGLKVTSRAFGFGRRMPIAQRYSPMLTWYGTPAPVMATNA